MRNSSCALSSIYQALGLFQMLAGSSINSSCFKRVIDAHYQSQSLSPDTGRLKLIRSYIFYNNFRPFSNPPSPSHSSTHWRTLATHQYEMRNRPGFRTIATENFVFGPSNQACDNPLNNVLLTDEQIFLRDNFFACSTVSATILIVFIRAIL